MHPYKDLFAWLWSWITFILFRWRTPKPPPEPAPSVDTEPPDETVTTSASEPPVLTPEIIMDATGTHAPAVSITSTTAEELYTGPTVPVTKPVHAPPQVVQDDRKKMPQPYPLWLFWGLVTFVAIIFVGLDIYLFYIGGKIWVIDHWKVAVALETIYVLRSFKNIGAGQMGARLFFGRPFNNLSSGLAFVPWFFFSLVRAPITLIALEIPAPSHLIFRGTKEQPEISIAQIAAGMRPPIRAIFRDGHIGEKDKVSDDPLRRGVTEEVAPIVGFIIYDLCKFITVVGTIEDATKQLEDIAVGFTSSNINGQVLRDVINDLGAFNKKLQEAIESRVEGINGWGIDIRYAMFKDIVLSHSLNTSVQAAAESVGKKKAKIIDAEGKAKEIELLGEARGKELASIGKGEGSAIESIIDGRTNGLSKQSRTLNLEMATILAADTLREVTDHPGQMIIAGAQGGISDLLTAGTALAANYRRMEGTPTTATPAETTPE